MNTDLMFSSKTDEWATPPELFQELDKEFGFELDPCSTEENHKCPKFFTKEDDGLAQNWGGWRVFCNPPYGRNMTGKWVEKAYKTHQENGSLIVLLLPARTDTRWFHDYIYKKAEIRFIKGRLKFGGCENAAPFPSMLVIYRKEEETMKSYALTIADKIAEEAREKFAEALKEEIDLLIDGVLRRCKEQEEG